MFNFDMIYERPLSKLFSLLLCTIKFFLTRLYSDYQLLKSLSNKFLISRAHDRFVVIPRGNLFSVLSKIKFSLSQFYMFVEK